MPDLISFVEFVVDIACLMVPLDEVETFGVTRDQSILVSLSAIGLLVLSITFSAAKEMFPGNAGVAVVVAFCVVGLGLLGLDGEMLKGLFVAAYPPMVIAMRFAEGAILGARTSWHIRWWHPLLMVVAIVAAFYLLRSLPNDALALTKAGWALMGTGIAAFAWMRIMADAPMFRSPFSLFSVFAVFAATLVYVSASPFELAFYQWSLPLGLGVGIVSVRADRPRFTRHAAAAGRRTDHG
ncbi:MAG: hypothetical protein AB7N24_22270 [Dehalococcoidia bacterium]